MSANWVYGTSDELVEKTRLIPLTLKEIPAELLRVSTFEGMYYAQLPQ